MGHFDESICDCCVCPMQCVLEQLVGIDNIGIVTPTFADDGIIINQVKDFIAFTNRGNFPICQISSVSNDNSIIPVIKQSIKQSKGVCSCCEDPITNLAKSMIGKNVNIELISPTGVSFFDEIIVVGEGIIVGRFPLNFDVIEIFSSCAVTRISN
ncbi:hypothetical protein VQL36_13190 [Chengkuizengella sp. SCS-71B]|uniref:hypothetical protein n=1 Tax=Chengkuizengella sp. SCS-71B TaxID=3115290 RepID=UPI0032C226C9